MNRAVLMTVLALLATGCAPRTEAASAASVLVPRTGVGAPYGSRDPVSCTSRKAPAHGAISASLAAQYFQCENEKTDSDGYLFLFQNVRLEVGKGVPYSQSGLFGSEDVSPNTLVYAIRGSDDKYLCGKVMHGSVLENEGRNCALWHEANAKGSCARDTFGDWKCYMTDLDAQQTPGQPPPK